MLPLIFGSAPRRIVLTHANPWSAKTCQINLRILPGSNSSEASPRNTFLSANSERSSGGGAEQQSIVT